ncbi:MAG: ATP-binding cassette domain-containing protein [Gammaproteobacteria bacterium]|nr:ATP-binding cassette domain-containing protein [Gammaproteobacteria bacterium]
MSSIPDPEPARERPAIETVGLSRQFGKLAAVDSLDLSVPSGALFGLLGPNGAGKSTLIKMLITLLPPSGGTATVAGCDIRHQATAVRHRIGYVPQLLSADGALTGRENLELFAKLYGIPRRQRAQRVDQVLAVMKLEDVAHTLVQRYSGGMIRRLEIGQSLLHEPRVLFLDEPTVGLDPLARQAVWERLHALRDAHGLTLFMTTHDMEEADRLCETVAIMNRGRVVALGTPSELKARVRNGASLGDVFAHFSGELLEQDGDYRGIRGTRRTASRLG